MRITFLLTQSLESPSGLGRYWPLAHELGQLGHQVTILALHHNWPELKRCRFTRNGVEIWYVGQMHVRKIGSHKEYFSTVVLLWRAFSATLALARAALAVPTDVYHVGKPHPMNAIAGLLAHWFRGKLVYLDCDDYEAGSNRFSRPWQRAVIAYFEDHMPRWVDGVTVNSRFMQHRLRKLHVPECCVVYVPNGVERARFSSQGEAIVAAARLREELCVGQRPLVLYVGTLSLTSHDVDLLLEAFARVMERRPDAMLVLVGGGEDLNLLQRLSRELGIEDHVRFVGRVPPEAVSAYYAMADVSVDPVRDTPVNQARSPLKLFESWAMGTPFVTADVGDRHELLGRPPAGGISLDLTAAGLGSEILAVLENQEIRHAYRELGRMRVEEAYWDRRVLLFERIYGCNRTDLRSGLS